MIKISFDENNYIKFSTEKGVEMMGWDYNSPYFKYLMKLKELINTGIIVYKLDEDQILRSAFLQDYTYLGFSVEINS